MQFRTLVSLPAGTDEIRHADRLLLWGSCFTEHIGAHLRAARFRCLQNPYGVLYNPSSIAAALNAGRSVPTAGIKLAVAEDNSVSVNLTIQAYYGYRLADVAAQVREAVADALKGQVGAETSSVDVYVDALAFEEK